MNCRRVVSFLLLPTFCFLLSCVITVPSHAQSKYWIEFRDKGIDPTNFRPGQPCFERVRASLSHACLERRSLAMRLPEEQTITIEDAPVLKPYLDSLARLGIQVCNVSKWCNAASAYLLPAQHKQLLKIDFIRRVSPVGRANILSIQPVPSASPKLQSFKISERPRSTTGCGYGPIIDEYGLAASQLARINIWPLHAMGFDASGVLLGFLDVGFRWRETPSLKNTHVISEYDYIFHDSVTENQAGDDPHQDGHGTATLSIAAGYLPSTLVGPAYNATLMLAKTEDIRSEHHIEEDNYAAALEDMEARGVEITSSSLGYFTFDPPDTSYTYADMNGHTTICAQAVERATKLGVLVVTAMGNSGGSAMPYVMTPADADSILSAGALDVNGQIAGFSSRGPTSDGRIKPEICAPGVGVWFQDPDGSFSSGGGTSFATPLISGSCCLIKQAHPEATAQEIRQAIMATGNNAAHPDTAYGWGKLNAYAAALELGTIVHVKNVWTDFVVHFCVGIASKYGVLSASVEYDTGNNTVATVPLTLAADSLIYSGFLPPIRNETQLLYRIKVIDGSGTITASPATGWDTAVVRSVTASLLAIIVTPNPVSTVLTLDANEPGDWRIFDAAGRKMLTGSIDAAYTPSNISMVFLANGPYYLQFISRTGETKTVGIVVAH